MTPLNKKTETLKNQKRMRKLLIKKQLCKHCGKEHPIIQNCNLKDVTQPVNQEGTMKKPTNKPPTKISEMFEGPNSSLRKTFDEATKKKSVNPDFPWWHPDKGTNLEHHIRVAPKKAYNNNEATKESRVLCFSCGKPIKAEDLGGVTSIGRKEAWFHKWLQCSIDVKLQRDS